MDPSLRVNSDASIWVHSLRLSSLPASHCCFEPRHTSTPSSSFGRYISLGIGRLFDRWVSLDVAHSFVITRSLVCPLLLGRLFARCRSSRRSVLFYRFVAQYRSLVIARSFNIAHSVGRSFAGRYMSVVIKESGRMAIARSLVWLHPKATSPAHHEEVQADRAGA